MSTIGFDIGDQRPRTSKERWPEVPSHAEVHEFFDMCSRHLPPRPGGWAQRLSEVETEIDKTRTYVHEADELALGAKLAWQHNTRCIGKLYWRSRLPSATRGTCGLLLPSPGRAPTI